MVGRLGFGLGRLELRKGPGGCVVETGVRKRGGRLMRGLLF